MRYTLYKKVISAFVKKGIIFITLVDSEKFKVRTTKRSHIKKEAGKVVTSLSLINIIVSMEENITLIAVFPIFFSKRGTSSSNTATDYIQRH